MLSRSAPQVVERLDRLIAQIREIQAPYMHGEKPLDVVLVRFRLSPPVSAKLTRLQVAHGLILRAFVKRWLKYPLDNPLPMMLSPGAIGILRYLLAFLVGIQKYLTMNLSYKNHDIDEPGSFIGMSLPSQA